MEEEKLITCPLCGDTNYLSEMIYIEDDDIGETFICQRCFDDNFTSEDEELTDEDN